jgi:hypothetical protein
MKSYGDVIDALLDTLEQKYLITEGLLKYRGLLEYITNPKNTETIKKFIIWAGRKREDFNDKQHATNYMLKVLDGMMKHSN